MKTLYIVLFFLSFCLVADAQQTITMNIEAPDTVWENDQFDATVNVTNFNNVGSFQIYISFDKNKLEVTEIPEGIVANTSIITNELSTINQTGEVRLVWLKLTGGSIGDDQLISISFKVKQGVEEGESSLWFSDDYVTDTNGETITTESTNKDIYIHAIPDPVIRIDEVPANPNSIIDVPVRFTDFVNIIGFELRINYHSEKVTLEEIKDIDSRINTNFLVYNTTEINDSTNQFVMMWIYDGANPLHITEENYEVFSLSFTYGTEENVDLTIADAKVTLLNESEIIPEYYSGKINNITSIEDDVSADMPMDYTLFQNYPNPFNPNTKIRYFIPTPDNITVVIYNNNGEQILEKHLGYRESGYGEFTFSGMGLSSGLYVYSIITDRRVLTNKMLLIK